MNAQYQHEHQVTAIIDAYQRDAIQAEQHHLARTPHKLTLTMAATSIRTFVRSSFATAGKYASRKPVSHRESMSVPSDKAMIA